MKIGVVCGFQSEMQCFWRAVKRAQLDSKRFVICPSGACARRGQIMAAQLVAQGCDRLLSFGIAGGLTPRLRVGDVVFSNHVVTMLDESYGKRPARRKLEELTIQGTKTHAMSACGVDKLVETPEEKACLHQLTRAEIVDMESHSVARTAQEEGVPFFVLRAVSDSYTEIVPPFLSDALRADGSTNLTPVIMELLKYPFHLPALLRLQKNTRKALVSLENAACEKLPKLL